MSRRRRGPGLPPQPGRPNGWFLDRVVEQAVYLERLKRGEARKAQAPLGMAAQRVREIVAGLLDRQKGAARPWESADYVQAVARVSAELRAAAGQVESAAGESMLRAARLEAEWQGVTLAKSLPVRFEFARVPESQLAALRRAPIDGHTLADWTEGIARTEIAQVTQALNRGLRRGAPIPEIAGEVARQLKHGQQFAETVTRTAITHASSGARQEFASANADVIVGVRWVATLDSRTSRQCAALDGQVFPFDKGPRPPAHPNCRSSIQLLTRSSEELLSGERRAITPAYLREAGDRAAQGFRPALDEAADGTGTATRARGSTDYGAWLARQPATVQDRVLGSRTRGRWFRSGELEIDQFVGDDYRPLTDAEIAEMWGLDLP